VIPLCGRELDKLRIRSINFTPLEWAAKKENEEIVVWLFMMRE
jgi:hypothetical protein